MSNTYFNMIYYRTFMLPTELVIYYIVGTSHYRYVPK